MFRTLFLWSRERQRRKNVFQKRKTSTSRKRSLRLESLENRQLLSVCPNTSDALFSADLSTNTMVFETANESSGNELSYVASVNINTDSLERPWTCEQNARLDHGGILGTLETSSNTTSDSEALTLSQLFESMDDETFSVQTCESEIEHGQIEPLVFGELDGEIPSYSTMSGGSGGSGSSGGSGGSGGRSQIYLSGGNAGTCKEGESRVVDIGRDAYSGGTNLPVDFKVNVGGIPELGLDKDYTLVWTSGNVTKNINSYDEDGYISLSFPADASTGTLRINALNDDIYDGDGHSIERGVVTLVPGSDYDVRTTITETEFFIEDRVWATFGVYVNRENRDPNGSSSSSGGLVDFGHAYWSITIPDWSLLDQYIDGVDVDLSGNGSTLDEQSYQHIGLTPNLPSYHRFWGYASANGSPSGPGILRNDIIAGTNRVPYSEENEDGDPMHEVDIFNRGLIKALLDYTQLTFLQPGTYVLINTPFGENANNCTTHAIAAAATVGLQFEMFVRPNALGDSIVTHGTTCEKCHVD